MPTAGKRQLLYSLGRVSHYEEAIRRVQIERPCTAQEFEAKRREVQSKRRHRVDEIELERLALLHFRAGKLPLTPPGAFSTLPVSGTFVYRRGLRP